MASALNACWTFSYWGLLLLVMGDWCVCVCVFVVHVIVYGFYSLFLSHPVLHCMYRPITFLLWTFVSVVFRCLCFLLFIVSPRPLLLFCVFCFAEYRAFSGPPWLWHSPIVRCYPRKTTRIKGTCGTFDRSFLASTS